MSIQTRRDPFFDEFGFNDQFVNSGFSDFFSNFSSHDDFFVSREDQLRRQLSQLHNYENRINHNLNTYQNYIDQLKKTKEQVDKRKQEIADKMNKLSEERSKEGSQMDDKKSENKVFKRVIYRTPEMEVEEQYDSQNPSNCYKIIKKAGEAPQILQGPDHKQLRETDQTRDTDSNISQMGSEHSSRFGDQDSQSSQMKSNMNKDQNIQSERMTQNENLENRGDFDKSQRSHALGKENQNIQNKGEDYHIRKEGVDLDTQTLQERGGMNQSENIPRKGLDKDFRSERLNKQIDENKVYHSREKEVEQSPIIEGEMTTERYPLGGDLDQKFDDLSKRCKKRSNELRKLLLENRDLSVEQLHDLAVEQNLV